MISLIMRRGRRPTSPRLPNLRETQLGNDLFDSLQRRIGTQAGALGCEVVVRRGRKVEFARDTNPLSMGLFMLVKWARTGEGLEPQDAQRTMRDVRLAQATVGTTDPRGAPREVTDLVAQLEVILLAAEARVRLGQSRGVTSGQLAALGGVDPSRVRQLVAEGELQRDGDGLLRPREAISWLARHHILVTPQREKPLG